MRSSLVSLVRDCPVHCRFNVTAKVTLCDTHLKTTQFPGEEWLQRWLLLVWSWTGLSVERNRVNMGHLITLAARSQKDRFCVTLVETTLLSEPWATVFNGTAVESSEQGRRRRWWRLWHSNERRWEICLRCLREVLSHDIMRGLQEEFSLSVWQHDLCAFILLVWAVLILTFLYE